MNERLSLVSIRDTRPGTTGASSPYGFYSDDCPRRLAGKNVFNRFLNTPVVSGAGRRPVILGRDGQESKKVFKTPRHIFCTPRADQRKR